MLRIMVAALAVCCMAGNPGLAACRFGSDYDLTLGDSTLRFERKAAPAQTIEMQRGALAIERKSLALGTGDRNRVLAFESKVRELMPQVKTLGRRAVDAMAAAVREEAAQASPHTAADPDLNARLDARVDELKRRITQSVTSKEWHADAMAGYSAGIVADVSPLIAGDLTQQALQLTMKGDLSGMLLLKDQALAVKQSLDRRIQAKLASLQPDIDRLCPSLRELDRLESGVQAVRLNLIDFKP